MRSKTITGIALALLITTTGCASEPETETLETEVQAPQTTTNTETVAPAVTAPEKCVTYKGAPMPSAEGGEQLATAIAAAELPEGVVMNPGAQIISSTDEAGMFEAVVNICSDPMTDTELRETANTIATALKADASSETLSLLVVKAWEPGEGEYLSEGSSVRAEYQLFTWDPTAGVPMSNNWD